MQVLPADLIKIAKSANNFNERLKLSSLPNQISTDENLINSRWQVWSQVVAQTNSEIFTKRLTWDDLDTQTINHVLGYMHTDEIHQLPSWIITLQEALQVDWEIAYANTSHCLDAEKPLPFEEVYLAFIYIARQRLIASIGANQSLLSPYIYARLERQLLLQLVSLCSQSLDVEFSLFKALKQSTFTFLWGRGLDITSQTQYQSFIEDLTTSKLLSFFQKYNVLARLVAIAVDIWVEEKTEFIQRLASNLPIIQQIFSQNLGQVVAIQLNISDLHNRGRSVIALTFASGLKLMYKPRGLGLEAAYFQLLAWCNQQLISLPFKLVKVIDCKSHGWMEYVEHLPCEDEAAAQRYYQRAGMLLCLVYVLQGNDCHNENLIASGEHPVLVDLETLLQPVAQEIDPNIEVVGGAQYQANQKFFDSVLRTGLLPRWDFGVPGKAEDISGLGGIGEETDVKQQRWQNINTDGMTLKYESNVIPAQSNTVFLDNVALSPNNYIHELVTGFQQMYQFLLELREDLLATNSPLSVFADQKVRFLFRNTQIYADVLNKAQNYKFLQNGIDRSIQLDVLSRAFLKAETKPAIWPLLSAELQALEQMDIPYFVANSSSDALKVNDLIIEGYFQEPSYDRMIARLKQLNDTDLAQQIAIIRGSFYSRVTRGMSSPASLSTIVDLAATVPLTQAQLMQEAGKIANELQQRAIQAADGSVAWIGMGYLPEVERMQLQPLGDGLYDGACGVSLFLAALAKVTGDISCRDLALNGLQDLKRTLQNQDADFLRKFTKQIGIGGSTGLGSIIYALVKISQFIDEPDLLDVAHLAAALINQASIMSDRQFDTIAGSAGAILGLLSLYQASSDSTILNQAEALGYHLLNNRTSSDSGLRAWATLEGKLATGFSHGAVGIAYTLLRLYKFTQDSNFLEAAEEAIAYEGSVFSPQAGNWQDVREKKPSFMTTWCHGAPGIGLGRLGGLEILDTPEIRQEIAVALNTTQQFGLQNLDHLCCGNFGRMEVLLVGATKLSSSELLETVQKQAATVVARAKQVGAFYLFPELPADVYNPGFFQGTAGIGYELLRLAYPEIVPSALLWE
ncbi:MAG: type 2 lantipeptide synthetase LanM family protein [Nostoc sp. LLA-1]|nr:type 2 lantipeptide synthetase LanM family protein [Cyanocohniella sp. LLY]